MNSQTKVLLMEDDRLYNLFLKQYLESCGFSVVEAWSLSESQDLLRHEQPDAVICDVGVASGPEPTARYLPMGGLKVLDWLASQNTLPSPDVRIVMSDTMTPRMRETFEARGVTAIFEKPVVPADLLNALKGKSVKRS